MASLLQNAKQQWVDSNGRPLVGGKVYFYQPGTEVPKTTWQDQAEAIANTNPVLLDSRGQAVVWGSGSYRQVVYDRLGALIWDQVTTENSGDAVQISTNLAAAGGSALVGYSQAPLSNAILRNVSNKLVETVSAAELGILTNDDPAGTATKFQKLMSELAALGSRPKQIHLLDTSDSYNINTPLILRRGVSLIGSGGKHSRIKNTNGVYNFFTSSVILPGNFHPQFVGALVRDDIGTTNAGSVTVTLTDPTAAAKYTVGMQVVIQSTAGYLSSGFTIPTYLFLNEVMGIAGAVITLKYAIDRSFAGGMTGLDGTQLGRNGIPLFFWQDAEIRNIALTTIGYAQSDSATLNCRFTDVYYNSRSAIYGNTYQKTIWSGVKGRVGTVGEMSLCSLDCIIEDMDLGYDPALATPVGTAIWGWQENTRNIRVRGGKIDTGSYASGAPMFNFQNTENVQIEGLTARPGGAFTGAVVAYNGSTAAGKISCKDNKVIRMEAQGVALARYVLITGDGTAGASLNNEIIDSNFYGTVSANECFRFTTSLDRHVIKDCFFEHGRPFFDGTSLGWEVTDNFINDGFLAVTDPDVYTRGLIARNRTQYTRVRQNLNRYSTSPLSQGAGAGTTALTLMSGYIGFGLTVRDTIFQTIRGNITGTAGTKTIRAYFLNATDGTTVPLWTIVIPAATSGVFILNGSIYAALFNSIPYDLEMRVPGTVASTTVNDVSTVDLTGKELTFVMDAVCAVATDVMSFRMVKNNVFNETVE